MYQSLLLFLVLNIFYLHIDSTVIRCEPPDHFLCKNKKCIAFMHRCDGSDDCDDGSDENDCSNFQLSINPIQCASDEFRCSDNFCIPTEKFCDTKPDCVDGSDEYSGCVKDLQCDAFRCNDGHCARNEWVCDGVKDCPDGSDERNCKSKIIPARKCNNTIDRYLCKNHRCIFLNATCNDKDDCGDGSDENTDECQKADSSCKKTANCEHYCRKTPEGAQCSCRSGYKLLNNRTCTDVNECENYGICDQQCINTAGSYKCSCQSGYALNDDGRSCNADGGEALMVFSTKSEIHGFPLNSKLQYTIANNLQYAVAVSLDANYVYWSDIQDGDEAILKSLEDGTQREVIVTTGLNSPDDIAVDWITGNIYFTDGGYMHIGVCSNDGFYCSIIVKERSNKPRGLALLPSHGVMYWSEWGSNSRILMAGMDGKNSSTLVTENVEWPNSLSIDYANHRLYWIDSKLKLIESIRLDGTDRKIVLYEVAKRPFSLAVFENKLYWSDWISNTIQSCNKFTGNDWNILVNMNSTIYGIHIYHSVLKPRMPNPCNTNPCSELCLLNLQSNYTCACTIDKELNSDRRTCREVKKKMRLIIATGNTFIDYYHELLGKPKMTASVTLKHVTAVAYNPLTGGVLASDQLMDNIFDYNTHTGKLNAIVSIEEKIIGGMDFDYIGNNLYLSDIKHKTIEVHSRNTNQKTIFYFKEEPHDIALVPEEGVMFVVFRQSNGRYRIDLMRMHGLGSSIPIEGVKTPLFGPKVSLAYDRDLKRLFWSDQGTGRINSMTTNGLESRIFRTGLSEPVSLAILGGYVFWTEYKSNQLHWTIKSDTRQYQKRITLGIPKDSDRLQLVALHNTYVKEHECRKNNGNCSHVCLLSNINSYICACPPDMMLNVDNRTCSPQTACKAGEVKCSEHDVCIKLHQRCNGVQDCPNGEDESGICDELRWSKCEHEDQFRCKNGECIIKTKRCNSYYDCTDRSDEEDCDKKECNSNEFQCHEGECISKYLVCNTQNDCADLSDEMNCDKHTCDANSFMCKIGTCIPKTWKCDGEADCPDSSDESDECLRTACPTEMFTCHAGRCIDMSLKCNGVDDCGDNSDEQYCAKTADSNYVNCTSDEYKCYGTEMCLPKSVKCNGVQNCPKNDDERDCARCQMGEYACDNQKCIDVSWVCDTANDCGDGSDEKDCDGSVLKTNSTGDISDCRGFKCSNGVCLPFDKVCNGIPDCPDQSDEFGQCSIACAKDNPCKNICHKTPSGPVCGCGSGYRLSADLKSCEDINECEQNVCSQICHNTDGSFVCSCYEEYVLRNDRTSCKVDGPQMELVTVTGSDIRKLSANLNSIQMVYETVDFDISGIDVNSRQGAVYWSNDILGTISKIHLKDKKRTIVSGLGRPEALAVDWITDNVYFNDNDHLSTIKVCNLEQQKCAKVMSIEAKYRAMSIAVDPKHGWLFWSQVNWLLHDIPTSKIYKSTTVGSNVTTIISRNTGVVYALTIDYLRSRLYWADTFLKTIESSNLDGSNRAIFLKTDIYQALSINIFEDALYWLKGTTGIIKKCKLYDNKPCTEISIGNSNIEKHFAILHTSRQPIAKNVCEKHSCSYMCISENNTAMCICHDGYSRTDNCIENTNTKIKFVFNTANQKNETSRQNGALVGVIIAMVACIAIASAYFYYQKLKTNFSNKNTLSIHFQNPSYEHQNEIASSLNCISGLPPGEHEYINPITNVQKLS